MKKISLILTVLFFSISGAHAQNNNSKKDLSSPLDIKEELAIIEKNGIPSFSSVNSLQEKADALYENKSWKEAAIAYELFAENANWLANLMSKCVEPYYSTSYDDRKGSSSTKLGIFIKYEKAANELKDSRNVALAKIGLCHYQLGDNKKAVAYLCRALDLLEMDQDVYWITAANTLARIVGYVNKEAPSNNNSPAPSGISGDDDVIIVPKLTGSVPNRARAQ